MRADALHIGQRVRHPQYGIGVVKAITEATAEIKFDEGLKTVAPEASGLRPAEPQTAITELELPLAQVIEDAVDVMVRRLGLEKPEAVAGELAPRWHGGRLVLHPSNNTQPKEVPMEVFFHKIVMMRNQLRVLEQKINGHPKLEDVEKVDMQEYITRCYGSMTTFNVLFKEVERQF